MGPAKEVLAAGESTFYTCEHVLTEVGTYTNVATVTGNEKPKESNKVVVKVPARSVHGGKGTEDHGRIHEG